MPTMKLHFPHASGVDRSTKLRFGLPGDAKGRRARIRAAIAANRETLRRLAK
jgi:hypothetical protein